MVVDARPPLDVPGLQARLEDAFAAELSARLPRLIPAAERLRRRGGATTTPTVRAIVTEVHALASSAVVVGAHAAARAARACEHRLLAYTDGGTLPVFVVEDACHQLDELLNALSCWRADRQVGVA